MKNTGLTPQQVYTHFKIPTESLSPITSTFSCMDFKGQRPIIGTPGGDFGEFLLAYNCYLDNIPDSNYSYESVKATLSSFIMKYCNPSRPFYKHTDAARIESINRHMGVEEFPKTHPENLSEWFTALVNPEMHGCGHLRSILSNQAPYKLQPGLVESVVCAFYDLYWTDNFQKNMMLEILPHPNSLNLESGLIIHEHTCPEDSDASPAFTPYQDGCGLFTLNLKSQSVFRNAITAPFFLEKMANKRVSKEEFVQQMSLRAFDYWKTTGAYLDIVHIPLIEIQSDGYILT